MVSSVDSKAMRKMNTSLVLNFIRRHPNTSRVEVAKNTGLNKATVSSLVDSLLEKQIVKESGYAQSKGGRKPIRLNYHGDSGYCIGIDIQGHRCICSLFNLDGKSIYSFSASINASWTDERNLLTEMKKQIYRLLTRMEATSHGLIGIGIAAPRTSFTKEYEFDGKTTGLAKGINEEYQIPVLLERDANCGALSLLRKGNISSGAFVHIDKTIGVGIVANGSLYKGVAGLAGEFGHTTISPLGLKCSCGSYGCWEEYASERALKRYIQENGCREQSLLGTSNDNFVSNCTAKAGTDVTIQKALETVGIYVGVGLSNVVNSLSPERVVIGGSLAQAHKYMMKSIRHSLSIYSRPLSKDVPFEIAAPLDVATGSAEFVIRSYLSDVV